MSTIIASSVDIGELQAELLVLVERARAEGLLEYDGYFLWQDGHFVERDTRAVVKGYERPKEHCPERCVRKPTDPDRIAGDRLTEQIIEAFKGLWAEYDNVRIIVSVTRSGTMVNFDVPGRGKLV